MDSVKITAIQSGFIDTEKQPAEQQLVKYLGEDSIWFYEMIKAVKTRWVDQGFKVTDISVRENHAIHLALVKAHVPYRGEDGKAVMIDREKIISFVRRFVNMSEEELRGSSVDFSFYVMGLGVYRINFSEDSSGVGLSIRYLTFEIPTFESVGYPDFYKNEIKKLINDVEVLTPDGSMKCGVVRSGGLILHVGPTGSGKSTSMASELGLFSEETTGTIITYEQPIEYWHVATTAPVRQFEIGRDIVGSTDADIREEIQNHLLRNNPSVVLFGEAREKADIRMMMDTGLKGHLVLGTMHASNVKDALVTLMAVADDENYLVASSLKAIVAHKLHVNKKGVVIPLFEILIPTDQDRKQIADGNIDQVIKNLSAKDGDKHPSGVSFDQHIKSMVAVNKLTPREASDLSARKV